MLHVDINHVWVNVRVHVYYTGLELKPSVLVLYKNRGHMIVFILLNMSDIPVFPWVSGWGKWLSLHLFNIALSPITVKLHTKKCEFGKRTSVLHLKF